MKETSQILEAYKKIDFTVQKAALATVVHVVGSSYRRPGARMLVTDDGNLTGAISGGCLEGDALRKALLVMHTKKAAVVTYDTTDDDDAKFGIGLGCNGIIHILLEPIEPHNPANPLNLLLKARSGRQCAVLVTIFSLSDKSTIPIGTCFLLSDEKEGVSSITDKGLTAAVKNDALKAMNSGLSFFKDYRDYGLNAFIEVLQPTIRLVIFGAGNDVIPVTEMADILGWETLVIDGRATHAKAGRFPYSKQVLTAKAEHALKSLTSDHWTFYLLMTHNFNYDLEVFHQLLGQKVRYIGVLGPGKKLEKMLQAVNNSNSIPANVYGPIGLDIGAEAAEEIALSIISEIKAVSAGKEGRSLKYKSNPIHYSETPLAYFAF